MGFKSGKRYGSFWEDAKQLHQLIQKFPFNQTGKKEHEFEGKFASTLMFHESDFVSDIITQSDKSTTVKSVYCFGKRHRPDMALMTPEEDVIAIELKFITYAGLKEAIGQGYIYRLRYRFVFLILIISERKKSIYEALDSGKEKDLEDTLSHLAQNMNIFTHVVPSFNLKPGMRKCIHFFPENTES